MSETKGSYGMHWRDLIIEIKKLKGGDSLYITPSVKDYERLVRCTWNLEIIEDNIKPGSAEINCKDKEWFYNQIIYRLNFILNNLKMYDSIAEKKEYHILLEQAHEATKFRCDRVAIGKVIHENVMPLINYTNELALKFKPPITSEIRLNVISILKRYNKLETQLYDDYKQNPPTNNGDKNVDLWNKIFKWNYTKFLDIINELKIISAIEYIEESGYLDINSLLKGIAEDFNFESRINRFSNIPEDFQKLKSYLKKELKITEDDLLEEKEKSPSPTIQQSKSIVKVFPKHKKPLDELDICRRELFENIVRGRRLVNDYRSLLEIRINPLIDKLFSLDLVEEKSLPEYEREFKRNTANLISSLEKMSRRDMLEETKIKELGEYALELENLIESKRNEIKSGLEEISIQ